MKSAGIELPHSLIIETYTSAFESARIGFTYSSALKALELGYSFPLWERPILAFLKSAGMRLPNSLMWLIYLSVFKSVGIEFTPSFMWLTYPSAFKSVVIGFTPSLMWMIYIAALLKALE